ncbi:MAG: hypothetical protein ACI8PZ_007411 [Myxococcota bacterium]|jgi:hypothetical protein
MRRAVPRLDAPWDRIRVTLVARSLAHTPSPERRLAEAERLLAVPAPLPAAACAYA